MNETAKTRRSKILTNRQIGIAVGILAVIGIGAFLLNGPLASKAADSPSNLSNEVKPLPVNVATIEFVDSISQSRAYTGTVRARHRSELGFEISGRVNSVSVDEGDQVEKGDTLAELDTETLKAQQGATLARLAQAKSLMDELKAGPRSETIQAARATMEATDSQHQNAILNLKRRTRLRDAGAISAEEYDQALFGEKTAKANLNAARERLSELESGTRSEQLAAQASAVRQLESAAKEIDVAIQKSQLLAPFSGTVTRRFMDPGSIANASAPVVKLVEQQHLEAWIGLPVEIASSVEIGSKHSIQIGTQSYFGEVTAKIRELDAATRTQTVLYKLESSASNDVVSGQLCEVQISSTVDSSGCWIPTSGLTKGVRGLWSVMVIVPDSSGSGFRSQKRDIEIVKTDSNRVLALGTIESGDRIIVNGVHRVGEGQLVTTTD